jgi:hypothetical protein
MTPDELREVIEAYITRNKDRDIYISFQSDTQISIDSDTIRDEEDED